MLEKILDYIHNYFVKEKHEGEFKIESGFIDVDFLQNGQYFKIIGSVLNDGVYVYPTELVDEEFNGQIWSMAVPRTLIDLAREVENWVGKYGDIIDSPFQSESFGGYSYTKGSSSNGQGGNSGLSWQSKFSSQLNAYRKIS